MRLILVLCTVTASGCGLASRCQTEQDIAQAQGWADAEACNYNPQGLTNELCSNGSNEPELVYAAAFCGHASLTCLAQNREWAIICFEPFDTSEEGSVIIREDTP